ncbi:MAG: hypothetical protein WC565_03425 [Parcubacteria group bacterium]
MPGLPHSICLRFPGEDGRCGESGSEAVPGEPGRVQTDSLRGSLHGPRHGSIAHASRQVLAAIDARKHGSITRASRVEPGPEREDRAHGLVYRVWDRLLKPLAFLIGLSATHRDDDALGDEVEIGMVKRGEFGAAKRAAEAEQQQRAVSQAKQGLRSSRDHLPKLVDRDGVLLVRLHAEAAPDAPDRLLHHGGLCRRFDSGHSVRLRDRRHGSLYARHAELLAGHVRGVHRHRLGSRRDRHQNVFPAPRGEGVEVRPVSCARRLRLRSLDEVLRLIREILEFGRERGARVRLYDVGVRHTRLQTEVVSDNAPLSDR